MISKQENRKNKKIKTKITYKQYNVRYIEKT